MLTIKDPEFQRYGYELKGDYRSIVSYLEKNSPMPQSANLYVRDDPEMHHLDGIVDICEEVYGLSTIETGYCNGYNSKLNCLEYHSCPEVDIAATDLVLLLADQNDVKDGKVDSSDCKAFLLKKGEAVVLYPYVFHFSPCKLSDEGFKCAIILTDGTNRDLEKSPSDVRLWKENKWLYAHPESNQAKLGAYVGITGENTEIKYQ